MQQDKKKVSVLFMLFATLFCVCLITANVLETKQLSFGPINLTAGIIVFPVSYIINDVVCEVWGYELLTGMVKRDSTLSSVWLHALHSHRSSPSLLVHSSMPM